ncbi:hypothetical protein [Methylocystis suflitae]|uniref:hypothetical protein n=1 Tax=Methylocystis suflitae TaxID=2951405 RepID=UPI002108C441|nr:hypothetical protein [Methylocystis suflitae]MCQ4188857.1 hypothetical protein [Methylocystis suflitae]
MTGGPDDLFPPNDGRDPLDPDGAELEALERKKAKFIGCPLAWFNRVFPIMRGKNELAVALHIYRQRVLRNRRTIRVSNAVLAADLGVSRYTKYRALRRLAAARIITVSRCGREALEITFNN